MVWVWVVTTAFVIVTFITVKLRGYKKMPHALRDAIAADAIFGAPFFSYTPFFNLGSQAL
jgi:heme/copper-type cytochrome/quinol oxidase subunit 3